MHLIFLLRWDILMMGVINMEKKQPAERKDSRKINVRVDPETRVCDLFDSTSIAKFPVAAWETDQHCMGMRVLDNFAEEHQM